MLLFENDWSIYSCGAYFRLFRHGRKFFSHIGIICKCIYGCTCIRSVEVTRSISMRALEVILKIIQIRGAQTWGCLHGPRSSWARSPFLSHEFYICTLDICIYTTSFHASKSLLTTALNWFMQRQNKWAGRC